MVPAEIEYAQLLVACEDKENKLTFVIVWFVRRVAAGFPPKAAEAKTRNQLIFFSTGTFMDFDFSFFYLQLKTVVQETSVNIAPRATVPPNPDEPVAVTSFASKYEPLIDRFTPETVPEPLVWFVEILYCVNSCLLLLFVFCV